MKKSNKKTIHFFIFLFFGGALIFFFYHPQPVFANDFSGDPNSVSVYNLEPSALRTDSKGTNTLDLPATTLVGSDITNFKQGIGSGDFTQASDAYLSRTDANLSSDFPFKSGTTNYTMSLAFWFRADMIYTSPGRCIASKYTAGNISWAIWHTSASKIRAAIVTDGTIQSVIHDTVLSIDTWYHVTVTVKRDTKAVQIRIKDENGEPVGTDIDTTHAGTYLDLTVAPFAVGAYGISYPFDGRIDEFVVFNDILTAEESTAIAKGTYGGSGLVAHYNLDENPAIHNTAITDSSGLGNNGTLSTNDGSTNKSVAGPIGQALSFDGSNDYVNIPNSNASLRFTGNGTISAWVNLDSSWSLDGQIFSKQNDAGTTYEWGISLLMLSSKAISLRVVHTDGGAHLHRLDSNDTIPVSGWHHVVGVWSSPNLLIYLDGNLSTSSNIGTGTLRTGTTQPSTIGVIHPLGTPSRYFNGLIDEVRIYNHALSQEEITALYDQSAPPTLSVDLKVATNGSSWQDSVSGTAPLNGVDFQATVSGTAVGTILYSYDCGDGSWKDQPATNDNPQTVTDICNYPSAGTYTATVRVQRDTAPWAYDSVTVTASAGGDPIAWWKLDETSGTTASDSSGNNNTGTLVNGPVWTTTGKINGALSLDGTNDYLRGGSAFNFTSENFTIAYWLKLNSYSTNQSGQGPVPIYKGDWQTNGYYSQINTSGGLFFATNQSGAIQTTSANNGVISLGTWTHVVYTRNGSTVTIYINGTDRTSSHGTHLNPTSSGSNFQVGAYGSYIYTNGLFDDVRIYNRALSQEEITALYDQSAPPTLSVDLKVATNGSSWQDSVSGTAPLNGVDFQATVSGTAQGTILYSYDCGDGSWKDQPATFDNPQTVADICNYPSAGTYTARVQVQRDTAPWAYDSVTVSVSAGDDTDAPVISNVWPTESDVVSDIGTVLSLQTDEHATCKYDIENRSFDEMLNIFSGPTAAPAIDSGLIGHWKFDEISGTNAADSSVSNKPGTLYGAPGPVWTAGKINNALLFDGANDYVDMGDQQIYDVDPGDKRTILGWIKAGVQSSNRDFFWKEGGCIGWSFELKSDGNIVFIFRTGTGCADLTTYSITTNGIRYDDNQWHLVAGVFDRPSNLMELFVDGESKGTATLNNAAGDGVGRLRIGSNWNNSTPFGGMIDDVRIYDWPLSAPQIKQLYMDETYYYTGALPDLEKGKTYTYFAKCRDDFGNTNPDDYPISFTVSRIITGGLRGHYNTMIKVGTNYYNTIKDANVETVNFYNNFDANLIDRAGQITLTFVCWHGAIFAEKDGTYNFRVDTTYGNSVKLEVDGLVYQGWSDGSGSKYLTAGWHGFSFFIWVWETQGTANTQRLYWTPPGESEELIPADHLSPQNWSDLIITIPNISKPKQRINYIVAGSGTGDAGEPHPTNLAIEVSLPSGVTWADVKQIENEVWIYWFYSNDTEITITDNNNPAHSVTVSGTQIKTVHGFNRSAILAKVPPELIPDSGNGNLSLSFDTTFTRADGVTILIPYFDSTRPEGRISIRAVADSEYWSVSRVMVYPLEGVNDDVRPFFIFGDGETKIEMPTSYRPNYIVMLSGTGAPPSDFDFLQKMGGTKLIPENPASLSLSNPETWYPVFGREGPQLDVLSPYPNYVPNEWSGAPDTGDGYIKNISVPSENTWIAFQYYSSNFPEDGVDGSGESTMMMAGGVFSSISLDAGDSCSGVTEAVGLVRQDCTGYSNCFTSLAAWQAAKGGINFDSCASGDLVCANKIAVAKIDGVWTNPEFIDNLYINGWTTDVCRYVHIYTTLEARHNGKWDTSAYRLQTNTSYGLMLYPDFVWIDGLQFYGARGVIYIDTGSVTIPSDIKISNNILWADPSPPATVEELIFEGYYCARVHHIWNNIFYSTTKLPNYSAGHIKGTETYFYNNTMYNFDQGVQLLRGGVNGQKFIKNNIAVGNNQDYHLDQDASHIVSSNNISQDGTSPDAAYRNKTVSFVSTASGSQDLHLSSSETNAKDQGVDLSADPSLPFNTDIDGQTRPQGQAWDIGADETGAGAPVIADTLNVNPPNYCSLFPLNEFSWRYSNALNEKQYQLQIDTDSNFTNCNSGNCDFEIIVNGLSLPDSTYNREYVPISSDPLPNKLAYGETYYWRVKVWNSEDTDSGWIIGPSFSTEPHAYPSVSFTWDPPSPRKNDSVTFSGSATPAAGYPIDTWDWTFPADATVDNINIPMPTATFASEGTNPVTLTVYDSDGKSCSVSHDVSIKKRYFWQEIIPW